MSSTTDNARGQVLAIFAISLSALLAVTALAFDAGLVYVERRDQQNAADAAALAGARFLPDDTSAAILAAYDVAELNGFPSSDPQIDVQVTTPYLWSGKSTSDPSSGFIEVQISNTRPSLFAGLLGILNWPVSARAVAANDDAVAVGFSILSLHETACPGLDIGGGGTIIAAGDVAVDSECNRALKKVSNNASLTVEVGGEQGACSVHGGAQGDYPGCTLIEGANRVTDPFETTPAPPESPGTATPPEVTPPMVDLVNGEVPPDGCPGSATPATSAEPGQGCKIPANYADSEWLVSPGLYPGGLMLNSGTFYLLPGVYYIEGGGINLGGGSVSIISVESDLTVPTPGGGVLIYNTEGENAAAGTVDLNGGDGNFYLEPYEGAPWAGFVVFQDRAVDIGGDNVRDISINGGDSDMEVRGLIYGKQAEVEIEGNAGTLITDQVIADQFKITGGGGTIDARREKDFLPTITLAGLVE